MASTVWNKSKRRSYGTKIDRNTTARSAQQSSVSRWPSGIASSTFSLSDKFPLNVTSTNWLLLSKYHCRNISPWV